MKKTVLTLTAIVVATLSAISQKDFKPGYIINKQNEIVQGQINLKNNITNSTECEFRTNDPQAKPIKYLPAEIAGYRIENSKYYISKEITLNNQKETYFLEYLLDGIVDLYYLKTNTDEYFFIEKDSTLTQLTNENMEYTDNYNVKYSKRSEKYKGVLTYLFQNSPGIASKIKTTSFSYKSLIKVTKQYHNSICNEYSCVDFSKNTNTRMMLEPVMGFAASRMDYETSSDHAYSYAPLIGINLRIIPNLTYYRWNFITGLSLSECRFDGEFTHTLETDFLGNNNTEKTYHIKANYNVARIPLVFEYSFPSHKVEPFLCLTFNNVFILSPSYEITRKISGYTYELNSAHRAYEFGLAGGFGVKYKLNNGSYVFVKNDAEYRAPSATFNAILDHQSVISNTLSFGFGFKID